MPFKKSPCFDDIPDVFYVFCIRFLHHSHLVLSSLVLSLSCPAHYTHAHTKIDSTQYRQYTADLTGPLFHRIGLRVSLDRTFSKTQRSSSEETPNMDLFCERRRFGHSCEVISFPHAFVSTRLWSHRGLIVVFPGLSTACGNLFMS